MIDWLFIMFTVIGLIIMFLLIFQSKNMGFYWVNSLTLFAIILFYICAVGVMELEQPYQFYNASSTALETGYHQFILLENIYFMYLFYLLIVFLLINWIAYLFEVISDWMKRNKMSP